jgi:phospholipid/cholesterol/gamma-HCH transport system substrate-binding protein
MTDKSDDSIPTPLLRGQHREIWLGAFILAGLISALVTLFALTDPSFFRGRYDLYTIVADAGGIRSGDPVQLRGVNIGRVTKFIMIPEGVRIRLEIEGEYPVPVGSRVEIAMSSLLGGMAAEIIPSDSTTMARSGDVLTGRRAEGVFDSAQKVSDSANELVNKARKAFNDDTIKNIQTSSTEMHKLLTELRGAAEEQRGELRSLTKSLKRSASGIENAANRPELERSIARLDTLTLRLDESTASLKRSTTSLETVMTRIEKGEGTLGKLSKDETLYTNLNDASTNLNKLIEDVRKNPRRYLKLSLL